MNYNDPQHIAVSNNRHKNRCLSCGTSENMYRRRYCSIDCRQRLRYNLNMRTGLLNALNTKYATFYFTEFIIILDVLPYGSGELFSYIFPRTKDKKPVEDFCTMSNILGNAWWAEKRRTNKRYLASQHILEKAKSNNVDSKSIKPIEIKEPVRAAKSLTFLKLSKTDLSSPKLQQIIKKAYWKQAKRHHPDQTLPYFENYTRPICNSFSGLKILFLFRAADFRINGFIMAAAISGSNLRPLS
jgi:hypothetical protein